MSERDDDFERIRQAVRQGMEDALRNEELTKRFWEVGYEHLSKHTTAGLTQWIGKRILMILAASALSASVAWAVITGRIK